LVGEQKSTRNKHRHLYVTARDAGEENSDQRRGEQEMMDIQRPHAKAPKKTNEREKKGENRKGRILSENNRPVLHPGQNIRLGARVKKQEPESRSPSRTLLEEMSLREEGLQQSVMDQGTIVQGPNEKNSRMEGDTVTANKANTLRKVGEPRRDGKEGRGKEVS